MHGIYRLLDNNARYSLSPRVNDPSEFIAYLRQQKRFSNGTLDRLPKQAIILHDARAEEFLTLLGYSATDEAVVPTGMTDPNVLYVVYEKAGSKPFIVNSGLPGCGGIATQAAELGALGMEEIIHVGTCGLVGDTVLPGKLVVSSGAYKDAGAIMLSDTPADEQHVIASPDQGLSTKLVEAISKRSDRAANACGYTIPIFYFQPRQFIQDLITGAVYPGGPQIGYFEMEEASFFVTCSAMSVRAGSVLIPSDRYRLHEGGLDHTYENNDVDRLTRVAPESVIAVFNS